MLSSLRQTSWKMALGTLKLIPFTLPSAKTATQPAGCGEPNICHQAVAPVEDVALSGPQRVLRAQQVAISVVAINGQTLPNGRARRVSRSRQVGALYRAQAARVIVAEGIHGERRQHPERVLTDLGQ